MHRDGARSAMEGTTFIPQTKLGSNIMHVLVQNSEIRFPQIFGGHITIVIYLTHSAGKIGKVFFTQGQEFSSFSHLHW